MPLKAYHYLVVDVTNLIKYKITTEPELSLGRVSRNLKCKIVTDKTVLPPSSPPGGVLDLCSYRRNSSFLSLTLLWPHLTIFHSFSTFEKLCSLM